MKSGPRILVGLSGRLGAYAQPAATRAQRTLDRLARLAGLDPSSEVSLLLTDNPTIRRLNRRWRRVDRPTDVLSFPLHELNPDRIPPAGALGDIVVSLPWARRDARRLGHPFDFYLAWLLAHGLLHLLGHDHHTAREATRMRSEERRLLNKCGFPDLYSESENPTSRRGR